MPLQFRHLRQALSLLPSGNLHLHTGAALLYPCQDYSLFLFHRPYPCVPEWWSPEPFHNLWMLPWQEPHCLLHPDTRSVRVLLQILPGNHWSLWCFPIHVELLRSAWNNKIPFPDINALMYSYTPPVSHKLYHEKICIYFSLLHTVFVFYLFPPRSSFGIKTRTAAVVYADSSDAASFLCPLVCHSAQWNSSEKIFCLLHRTVWFFVWISHRLQTDCRLLQQ